MGSPISMFETWTVMRVTAKYSTGFKYIEKVNATATQPQRNVSKYFAIFKNVEHSLEPGETPRLQTMNNVLKHRKN